MDLTIRLRYPKKPSECVPAFPCLFRPRRRRRHPFVVPEKAFGCIRTNPQLFRPQHQLIARCISRSERSQTLPCIRHWRRSGSYRLRYPKKPSGCVRTFPCLFRPRRRRRHPFVVPEKAFGCIRTNPQLFRPQHQLIARCISRSERSQTLPCIRNWRRSGSLP